MNIDDWRPLATLVVVYFLTMIIAFILGIVIYAVG